MAINSMHIASSFLLASKLQVEITSRNLSGANDPNYSKQTALVKNVGPGINAVQGHTHGLGVLVEGFDRSRDSLLDGAYRFSHREAEGARSVDVLASRLESALGDGSGLNTAAQDVRLGLLEVANHPEDSGLRADLFQKLGNLSDSFQSTSRELTNLAGESKQRVGDALDRVNSILHELSDLNQRMPPFGKTSGKNALLDQQDALLDELSGYAEVKSVPQPGGAVAVYLDGRQLLYGSSVQELKLNSSQQIETQSGVVLQVDDGVLGALHGFYQKDLPAYQQKLDTLAKSIIDDANSVHENGYGLDGVAGRALFSGDSAATMAVAITDPSSIAAAASRMSSTSRIHSGTFSADNSLSSQAAALNVPPATSGTININGVDINWNDGQNMTDILNSFSAAGVVGTFDQATGKVLLQRDPAVAGPPDITISDTSGNLSQTFALDTAVSAPGIPGDGEVLRSLQDKLTNVTGMEDGISSLQTQTGSYRRNAQDTATRAGLLESDAQDRRNSVSAVSTDEELLNLQRYEQSFQAAARVANVADQILSTIVNLGRN